MCVCLHSYEGILKTKKQKKLIRGDFVDSLEKADKNIHNSTSVYMCTYIYIYMYIDRSTNMNMCSYVYLCAAHVSI
jgi:hypothetical protein